MSRTDQSYKGELLQIVKVFDSFGKTHPISELELSQFVAVEFSGDWRAAYFWFISDDE